MAEPSQASSSLKRAEHAADMAEYSARGERLVGRIGNRGPIRFDANGKLHAEILEAYGTQGFYVLELSRMAVTSRN